MMIGTAKTTRNRRNPQTTEKRTDAAPRRKESEIARLYTARIWL